MSCPSGHWRRMSWSSIALPQLSGGRPRSCSPSSVAAEAAPAFSLTGSGVKRAHRGGGSEKEKWSVGYPESCNAALVGWQCEHLDTNSSSSSSNDNQPFWGWTQTLVRVGERRVNTSYAPLPPHVELSALRKPSSVAFDNTRSLVPSRRNYCDVLQKQRLLLT